MLNRDAGITTGKLSDLDTVAHDTADFCPVGCLPVLGTNGWSGCRMVCVRPGFGYLVSGKPEDPLFLWVVFHLFWLLLSRLII